MNEIYGPPVFGLDTVKHQGKRRRYITKIIIHCSDSTWGDFKVIDEWHTERGWSGIRFCGRRIVCGYHYIILNGKRTSKSQYAKVLDGQIEKGRPDDFIGAHCKGQNTHSLGICLIGVDKFTDNQYRSLSSLVSTLLSRQNLTVHPHRQFSNTKTCPNFDVKNFMKKWQGSYWDD